MGTALRRAVGIARLMNMRGDERVQNGIFSYVLLEQREAQDHTRVQFASSPTRRWAR
jgi:hypothetical protein